MELNLKIVKYLDIDCIMYTDNNNNDYLNVSKWTTQNHSFSDWYRQKSSKQLIEKFKLLLGLDTLIIRINNVSNEYKGSYCQKDLAIQIAQWISPEFAFKVSKLINEHIQEIINYKYINIIKEKDDKIREKDDKITRIESQMAELIRKSDRLIETSDNIQLDNKRTHIELYEIKNQNNETKQKLVQVVEENKEVNEKLIQVNEKLEQVTDLLEDVCINTVPTDAWNKLAVFKENENNYRVVRGLRKGFEKRTKKYNNLKCIFEIDLPNGIEYYATFRDTYAKNKTNNKIKTSYAHLTRLDGVSESDLIEILEIHRQRVEELIKSKI